MNRRRFLGLFSATTAATLARVPGMMTHQDSWVISEVLGVRFKVPRAWDLLSSERLLQVGSEQVLFDDGISPTPFCGYTKYPEPTPRMNPSIGVFLDRHEEWMGENSEEFAVENAAFYATQVENAVIETPGDRVLIDGHQWTRTKIAFDFNGQGGFFERVRMLTMTTFTEEHVLLLNLTDSFSGVEKAQEEFLALQSSIQHRKS
jgi:hypothetical protein